MKGQVHTGLKLPGHDRVLNLVRQLYHRVHFLAGFLSSPVQLFELLVHDVVTTEEGVDLVLLDRKASLD